MNFGFTATLHGCGLPLSKIKAGDYARIWGMFQEQGLIIIYKFKHEFNDAGKQHVHFHGVVFSLNSYIDYKEWSSYNELFSVKWEDPHNTNWEKWHNYCMHEMQDKISSIGDEYAPKVDPEKELNKFLELARPLKQKKIKIVQHNSVMKLELFTNI